MSEPIRLTQDEYYVLQKYRVAKQMEMARIFISLESGKLQVCDVTDKADKKAIDRVLGNGKLRETQNNS